MFQESFVPYTIYNVCVDSRFRDISKYLNPYEYVVSFDDIFKDVISVELVFAVYEKNGTDLYVNVHIEELSPNLISNSNFASGSFCQLPMLTPLNSYDSGMYKCIKIFEKPLAKLTKLSIRFLKPDGTQYPMNDHLLKFEINCMKLSGTSTEWKRNEVFAPKVSMFRTHDQHWDAYKILNPHGNTQDIDALKREFKKAAIKLKNDSISEQQYKERYKQLRDAFKNILEKL